MNLNLSGIKLSKRNINVMFAILISAYIGLPYFQVRVTAYFLVISFIVWFITTDLNWLKKIVSKDTLFLIIFFFTFIPYILTSTLKYGSADPKIILVSFPIFFMGVFIGQYYTHFLKDDSISKKIVLWFILFYTIGLVQTYFGLKIYPMASRELAGAVSLNPELVYTYGLKGIGGFGFIYGSVFLSIPIFKVLISKNKLPIFTKILLVIYLCFYFLTLLSALYAISIIITVIGFSLIIFLKKGKNIFSILGTLLLIILLIPNSILGEFILMISNVFKNNTFFYNKFVDLGHTLLGNPMLSTQTSYRIELYLDSFKAFIHNPLFGIYGPLGDQSTFIGQHSGWLDLLGMYGMLTGIPILLFFYYNYKKNMQLYKLDNKAKLTLSLIIFLFVIFGIINPILNVVEIGYIFLFIIPMLPVLWKDLT